MSNTNNNDLNKGSDLRTMPIGKLMFRMAVPTVLAQLVNLLYNIVDRIYVGRIPEIGSFALAGLGVTFPIILLISAFALLVGMGGGPRAAIAMGKKDNVSAEKLLGNSVTLLVIFSVVLSAFFMYAKDDILMMFGASESTLPYASSYLSIYLFGTIFVQVALGLNMFITNQGFAKTSMATVFIGCSINILLDPILIFGFDMGVEGAALATVISQCVSAVWVIVFLSGKKTFIRIRPKYLKLNGKIIFSIISLGISPFIMQATECVIQLAFNKGMQTYGNDMYVAMMSVLFSLMQIIFLPLNGLGQGAQPIMGYNYGAGDMKRVKEASNKLIIVCFAFSILSVLAIELFPSAFIGMFTPDPALIELSKTPLRIFLIGMSVMGAQIACQQTFLALGRAKISILLAVLRKIILLLPLAIILPNIAGLGIWGLLLAEPISDTIAAITAVIVFKLKRKELFASVG